MAGVAVKTSVYQYCIQNINNRFSVWLRHVWSNIKIFRIFYILNRNGKRKRNMFLKAQIIPRVWVWGPQGGAGQGTYRHYALWYSSRNLIH